MLDSFSESSADELETLVQNEVSNLNNSSSSNSSTNSQTDTFEWNVNAGIELGNLNIGGGVGGSNSTTLSNTKPLSCRRATNVGFRKCPIYPC